MNPLAWLRRRIAAARKPERPNRATRRRLAAEARGKGGVGWRQRKMRRGERLGRELERLIRTRLSPSYGEWL